MLSVLLTAVAGAVFGLALAAPPGPMNAVIAEESVIRGWHAGFWAGLGAMTADALFFGLTLAGVATLLDVVPAARPLLSLFGGLLMAYFAVGALRDAASTTGFTDGASDDSTGFRKTLVLSLTNPYQIAFWATVGVGLVRPGTLDVSAHLPAVGDALAGSLVVETGSPALLLGFFGGVALWIVAYPAGLVAAGRRVDSLAPIVAAGSGLVLAGFGVIFLATGIGGLL